MPRIFGTTLSLRLSQMNGATTSSMLTTASIGATDRRLRQPGNVQAVTKINANRDPAWAYRWDWTCGYSIYLIFYQQVAQCTVRWPSIRRPGGWGASCHRGSQRDCSDRIGRSRNGPGRSWGPCLSHGSFGRFSSRLTVMGFHGVISTARTARGTQCSRP